MYNPNKTIREKVFPVKIGKFLVNYYTFEETSIVESPNSPKNFTLRIYKNRFRTTIIYFLYSLLT